jgi:5'-nucleotidase (lipoprotein e(P4) family)
MKPNRSGLLLPVMISALLASALPVLAADAAPTPQNDDLDATLWDQTSVEAKAASIGEYDLGRMRLDQALADKNWTAATEQTGDYQNLPPAVILDIDDTVLNTSAYQAWTVVNGTDYSGKTWDAYVAAEKDVPIAGAIPFLDYAASKGVTIFYVTNRDVKDKAPTEEEMKKLGFPRGDGKVDTFLFEHEQPDWSGAKGVRFAYLARNYRILLLFGDNMGDFTDDINGTVAQRDAVYQKDMAHWGHDWIAISNPTYGSWQSAPFLSDYKDNDDDQQRQKEEQALSPWSGPGQ